MPTPPECVRRNYSPERRVIQAQGRYRCVDGYIVDVQKFDQYFAKDFYEPLPLNGSCDCPAGPGCDCQLDTSECVARAARNGRLSVRAWFREMRAADFAREIAYARLRACGRLESRADRWTLFDTLKVVERETAAFHLRPQPGEIYFAYGGRIVGKIEGIAQP